MPKLVRIYVTQVLIGFGLSGIFVSALLYTNVGNLWHLISSSQMGWIAAAMLFMFNGVVFAGVQFAIVIMRLQDDDKPARGKRIPVRHENIPVRVASPARRGPLKRG